MLTTPVEELPIERPLLLMRVGLFSLRRRPILAPVLEGRWRSDSATRLTDLVALSFYEIDFIEAWVFRIEMILDP